MCSICDGARHDDVLFDLHRDVTTHGWALQGVSGSPPHELDWVYSIGLVGFEHPELIVAGAGMIELGAVVLHALGERIRGGSRFDAGDEVPFPPGPVTFGSVHPAHIERGLVASWVNYYGSLGGELPPVDFLQVILPERRCSCAFSHEAPLLSDPSARLDRPPPRRRPTDRLPSYRRPTARRRARRR
jgi:hypothetical protein